MTLLQGAKGILKPVTCPSQTKTGRVWPSLTNDAATINKVEYLIVDKLGRMFVQDTGDKF